MKNNHTVKKIIPRLLLLIAVMTISVTALYVICKKRRPVYRPSRFKGFYSDGEMLFIFEKDRLLQCDIGKKTKMEFLKGDIRALYADSEYIIYSDGKNLKIQERSTGRTETVMEFEKYIRPATKTNLKGVKLMKTEALTMISSQIVRKGREIYFCFLTGYELQEDEHYYLGSEEWNTLYRYDMETKTLYPMQTGYCSPEDEEGVWISHINVIDEYIYFLDGTGCVLRMNGDGTGKEKVYEFGGGLEKITWKEDGFNCFVYKKWGELPNEGYDEFVSVDKDGNVLFRGNLHEMFQEEIENGSLYVSDLIHHSVYDSESDRYLFMSYDELKSVVIGGDTDANISAIAVLEELYDNNKSSVISVKGHIFVSMRDAVYGGGYSVFDVSPTGEVSTFIKVDD